MFVLTTSDKNQIIKRLKKIVNAKGYSINLSGKLKNDNEFKLTDKITIGIFIPGGGSPAILRGKFTGDVKNNELTIFARSHIMFPLVSILIPVCFILLLLFDDLNRTNEKVLGTVFGLVVSIIMNLTGNFLKQRLLKKTLKGFGLER